MTITAYQPFILAIQETFGTKPWTPGEATKKAKPKNAVSGIVKKAAREIKVSDTKKLIYELWEQGMLELVPPKPNEQSYRIRLISRGADVTSLDIGEELIEKAYLELKKDTKTKYVFFSELAVRAGRPVSEIHQWALNKAKNGEAALSEGDFSLAYEEQRKACFDHAGKKFLLVGLIK